MIRLERHSTLVQALVLAILAVLPYLPALSHDFVYDDGGSIAENRFLAESSAWEQVLSLRVFTRSSVPDGRRPLVILSYLLDRAMWGVKPFGYHLTNLLWHAGCVLLFFALMRLLAKPGTSIIPFAAALLFALHPVASEAVLVPAFREDLLCGFFLLGFLLAGLRGSLFALPLLAAALLSKESAVLGPLLLAWIWACHPARTAARPRWRVLLPAVVLTAGFALSWALLGGLQAVSFGQEGVGLAFPSNWLTLPGLWLKTLRYLAWPWPLIADHIIPPVTTWQSSGFLGGTAILWAWVVAALACRNRFPRLALGLGWILLGFAPVSNAVPLFNPFAERYLYFPAAGAALLAAGALDRIPRPAVRWGLLVVLAAGGFALISLRRPDWANDALLWDKTLRQEPRSARAHTWTGLARKHTGDRDAARRLFEQADQLNPRDTTALINLAVMSGEEGRLEEAVTLLQEAIRRRPDKPEAYQNLAVALKALGREPEAARLRPTPAARAPLPPAP